VCSPSKRLSGGLPLADLLRADPELRLGEVVRRVQRARVDAELEEIARLMADYDRPLCRSWTRKSGSASTARRR
jgi:Mg/Co/Ni transporter MgtE